MYTHLCLHTHTYTPTHSHTYTPTHSHLHTHTLTHLHTHTLTYTPTHLHTHTLTHLHTHTLLTAYHVAHSNPRVASELLHQGVVVCGEECSALHTLSQLKHSSACYCSSVIRSSASTCRGDSQGREETAKTKTAHSISC